MDLIREQMILSLSDMRSVRREYSRIVQEEAGSTSPALRVRMRAITANKVTRNKTFYPVEELEGDGVSKGYITALKPYPIPIMLDHRTTGNSLVSSDMPIPVGRVVDARVVRKGRGRKEGYLEVDALLFDRRVMEMVMDGRFLTVSIGQIPERVECSVCGEAVQSVECPHGHMRGNTYEWHGELKQCYHIMRGIELIEISFVNVPSDSDAMVISKTMDSGTLTTGGFEMAELDSLVDGVVHEAHTDAVTEHSHDSTSYTEAADGEELREESTAGSSQESVEESAPVGFEDGDEEVSPEELYCIDGELPFPEAKLTAAQRKRLPDSAFCGPNRSFPAHDRAHVLAGLRLLGRAKLSPAQKARVRACLLRKARALGMKTGQDDDRESMVVFWLMPESRLDVKEVEYTQLPSNLEGSRVVLASGGTVLVELCDEQFELALHSSPTSNHTGSDESVLDENAELKRLVEELEGQLVDWQNRATELEQRLAELERESLVSRAVSLALSAGYPAAANKTAQELTELFRQRSSEFLQSLIEDLSAVSSPADWSKRLDDVKNPLEGIMDQTDGSNAQTGESDVKSMRSYSAVDELLDAIKSGELQVTETDEDDVIRVFFK
jgi:hypothetical protein